MKKLLPGILIGISLIVVAASCNQKEKVEKVAQLLKVDSTINSLHQLEFLYRDIYSRSLYWVYWQTDFDNRGELREDIFTRYPMLKDKWQRQHASFKGDVGFAEMDTLITITRQVMEMLVSFDDYDDEATVERGKQLCEKGKAVFDRLEGRYAVILSQEESNFALQAKGDDDETVKAIVDRHERVRCFHKAEQLGWEIYVGAFRYVYRPEDVKSKERFKNNVDVQLSDALPSLSECLSPQDKKYVDVSSLVYGLDTLRWVSQDNVLSILKTAKDYDDPLTKLLAEDGLESALAPVYRRMTLAQGRILERLQNMPVSSDGASNASALSKEDLRARVEELERVEAELEKTIKRLEEENKKLRRTQ